ncbi:MAG: C1 family peptidase [Bacteroidota bacterium]
MRKASIILFLSHMILFLILLHNPSIGQGLEFDDKAYYEQALDYDILRGSKQSKLPPSVSLKAYAPTPKDQGSYNNCVAWASAYAARGIMEAYKRKVTNKEIIQRNAFAPGFIYKLIAPTNSCYEPTSIELALKVMQEKGAAKYTDVNQVCPQSLSRKAYASASRFKIKDYKRLFYYKEPATEKIQSIKQALSEAKPVIVGMRCTPSFEHADGYDLWKPKESKNTHNFFGHAMCILAYNDSKYGGAFQIMNSWGTRWGNKGFIWVRYQDFTNFVKYAFVMYPTESTKTVASRNK